MPQGYLGILLGILGWFMAEAAGASVSLPSPADCGQCHTETDYRAVAISNDSHCMSCHESKLPHLAASQSSHTLNPITPASTESRLSAEPNPMTLIPAGEFIMGTDARLPDEGPQHKVTLAAYWIDLYEVTNQQYKKFIDATARRSPAHFINRVYPAGKTDHPVTEVT